MLFQVKRSAKDKKGNLEDFDMEKELAELDSVKTEEPPKVLPKVLIFSCLKVTTSVDLNDWTCEHAVIS